MTHRRFPAPNSPAASTTDRGPPPRPPGTSCELLLRTIERELAHLVHLVDHLRELAGALPEAHVPDARPARQRRALVVAEDGDEVATWTSLLRRADYETLAACSGPEALATAKQTRPELVLLDIDLPSVNRFEIARLRAEEGLRGALLVAVTAWGAIDEQTPPRAAGFDFYLTKPLTIRQWDQLLARLRDLDIPAIRGGIERTRDSVARLHGTIRAWLASQDDDARR